MPRSRPIIVAQAILTGLGILFAGTALADISPLWTTVAALGALGVLAAKGGIDFYVNATTTPTATVVATQTEPGAPVVAGPRAAVSTGAVIPPSLTVADVAPPVSVRE